MKPCRKNRKRIVWLTLSALDSAQAAELQSHLQSCEGCRLYLKEISLVTQKLNVLGVTTVGETVERPDFPTVKPKVSSTHRAAVFPGLSILTANWRLIGSAVCALVVTVVLSLLLRSGVSPAPAPTQTKSAQPSVTPADVLPTVANYEAAIHASLDSFDELLSQQAHKPVPAPGVFTSAMLAQAISGD